MLPLREYSFSTYAKFSEKLTFFPLIRSRTCVYQGLKNVSFSENFAYVLNEWSLIFLNSANLLNIKVESLSYLGSNILETFPLDLKQAKSLSEIKAEIKKWNAQNCPWRLWKTHLQNIGFIWTWHVKRNVLACLKKKSFYHLALQKLK